MLEHEEKRIGIMSMLYQHKHLVIENQICHKSNLLAIQNELNNSKLESLTVHDTLMDSLMFIRAFSSSPTMTKLTLHMDTKLKPNDFILYFEKIAELIANFDCEFNLSIEQILVKGPDDDLEEQIYKSIAKADHLTALTLKGSHDADKGDKFFHRLIQGGLKIKGLKLRFKQPG